MKIISLFNHKGGVSKTTTTFNLGWMLASQGHKTLIVDADPQCNLTALVLGYNKIKETEDYYKENPNSDMFTGLKPILNGNLERLTPITPIQTTNPNLSLICGNISLAEVETQFSVALTTSQAIPAIRNIPGSAGALLRETAIKYNFDFVIIDMSPSVGALNQCLLMASDYFIVPTFPDFFCAQAIKSLSNVLPRWNQDIQKFRSDDLVYKFPDTPPKFIGFISQKYRPRNGAPAKSFQRWIDEIVSLVEHRLVPSLAPHNMTVTEIEFKGIVKSSKPFNLANISDFNSLIAQSQKHNNPVFNLTDRQIEQGGEILKNMKISRERFKKAFRKLAKEVVLLAK
ncbi:ParA family protein [Pseudomonas oryzihabitans]|uniref:AAA domain-containing protein n=1 Tax=Pseudomonas oryzihabitans TaxID=47885 RepID=A0ABX3IPR7_9PSED|nr:AAA family ATPase [Pseudomonas psychrotolerans]ONN69632.1 hypothetical protein BVL52_15230 [Pseudomonas psychrotolerans]